MTWTRNLFRTTRLTLRIMIGGVILFHLVPLAAQAGVSGYAALNEVRIIDADVIRLSDVFTSIDKNRDQTIGTAPRPGQDMVLNARTLMKLAVAYGVKWTPSTSTDQIVLRREGTIIDAPTIQSAVRDALVRSGASGKFETIFDASPSAIVMPKNASPDISILDVSYNPVSSRFSATLSPTALPARTMPLSGRIEPVVDVPIAARTIAKGETLSASDIETIEMRSSLIKNDMPLSAGDLPGLTARRHILAGKPLRNGDVEIPISVTRGERITLIYQTGAMELAAQGRALQDGRRGDRVRVVNIDSNKNLQGTITADNRVVID